MSAQPDPTAALFDAVRAYAAAYYQGHVPKRVVVVYDDGTRDGRPIPLGFRPAAPDNLSEMEATVLEAIGADTLTGQQIADAAGYPLDKDLKACLASMRRKGLLTGRHGESGYSVSP